MSPKACRCAQHAVRTAEQEEFSKVVIFNIKRSKAVSKAVINHLYGNNYLSKDDTFLCSCCVDAVKSLIKLQPKIKALPPSSSKKPSFDKKHFINLCKSFTEEIESFGEEIIKYADATIPLQEAFYSLGNLISGNIFELGKEISTDYKDAEKLSNVNSNHFISSSDPFLVKFLEGILFLKKENLEPKSLFTFCMVIESIYYLRNRNHVLPHHFLCNLLQSSTSGSKFVSVVNGKFGPSGGYTTYSNWLRDISKKPLKKNLLYDIDFFLDNLGKYLNKSYQVSAFKTNLLTIVTSTLNIKLEPSHLFSKHFFFKTNLLAGGQI